MDYFNFTTFGKRRTIVTWKYEKDEAIFSVSGFVRDLWHTVPFIFSEKIDTEINSIISTKLLTCII